MFFFQRICSGDCKCIDYDVVISAIIDKIQIGGG